MQNGHVLIVLGTRAGFAEAFVELRRALDTHRLAERARYMCELVFEEIVTNIIRHGYTDDREHRIRVSLQFQDDSIVMGFEDDGVAFDPRQALGADMQTPVGHTELGGRGLLLVRKAARRIQYDRTPEGLNRLTVTIAA